MTAAVVVLSCEAAIPAGLRAGLGGVPVRTLHLWLDAEGRVHSAETPPAGCRLPERGHRGALADGLVDALGGRAPAVVLAADRVAEWSLWLALPRLPDVLGVTGAEAAARAAVALADGASVAALRDGQPFSTGTALAVAPGRVTAGALAAGWVALSGDDVVVDRRRLSPAQRAALDGRGAAAAPAGAADGRHLVVGPDNREAKAFRLARAVRAHLSGWSVASLDVHPPTDADLAPSDHPVSAEDWAGVTHRVDLAVQLAAASHVLVTGLRPLLAAADPSATEAEDPAAAAGDLELLASSGRQVALLVGAGDVRALGGPALLGLADRSGVRLLADDAQLADRLGVPWLPPVVDPACFAVATPVLTGRTPVVVRLHEPGAGAGAVDAALDALGHAGLIEVRRSRDRPGPVLAAALRQADVVLVDPTEGGLPASGWAALAAGRLLVAGVPAHTRRLLPLPPPVVDAEPAAAVDVLLAVLDDQAGFAQVAASGPSYARQVHDGTMSARILAEVLCR